jgi:hypothetical protein
VTDGHPNDDELVLHYYEEATPGDHAAIAAHLAVCGTCRARWSELTDIFGAVASAAVPEPGEDFERRMWTRVRTGLACRRSGWRAWPRPVLGALAASIVAAALTGSVWVSLQIDDTDPVGGTSSTAGEADDARRRVLFTALDDHLAQTEVLLVEVLNAPAAEPSARAFRRAAADDLVASGRLFRDAARTTGDVSLADMLDDLEGVLVEVASGPEPVDRRDVDFLRARIEDNALLFKVRAMATDINGRHERLLYQP